MTESRCRMPEFACSLTSDLCHLKVGFPIRKSADQSFFAAPRGLSQRSTSFIASQRQGIHRMPLRHLIALIINTQTDDREQMSDVRSVFYRYRYLISVI